MRTTERISRCLGFLMGLAIILWGVGCAGTPKKVSDLGPTPPKAPQEALIDSCENNPETQQVICPLKDFLKALYNYTDLFEYSTKCAARLKACEAFGAVDRAELQGQVNEAKSERDSYKAQRWYFLGGGLVGGVVLTILAAIAF
jgi:hypothetical protein